VNTAGADTRRQSTSISNAIAALHREHYGRGADRVRTLIHHDVVMTTLEDCFTTVERKMVAEGKFPLVRDTRTMFQDWMTPEFVGIVEEATGRTVRAFFSQVTHDPDIALELFLLEPDAGPPAAS
jgi:uncharacterized protein YbcI